MAPPLHDQPLPVALVATPWLDDFTALITSAKQRVILCAPFVSTDGVEVAERAISKNTSARESLVLTDLSPRAVSVGATDPLAISRLVHALPGSQLVHLPRLHAKVYCVDGVRAIVTSGNLTHGGLVGNHECGVVITDPLAVAAIESQILAYANLGATIDHETLARYCDAADEIRAACKAEVDAASRAARQRLSRLLNQAQDELLVARLRGDSMHSLFARTILFLLRREGPMSTVQLNAKVQHMHPDLCDDTVDRVISGKRFGKKWKHAVRSAQQQLKRSGEITLVGKQWDLAR